MSRSSGSLVPQGRRSDSQGFQSLAILAAVLLLAPLPAAAQSTLLVHLPGAPVETSSHLAEAVAGFAAYLSERLPGHTFEPRLFRRWSDAHGALTSGGERVALTLTEAGFLVALEPAAGLEPTHRLVRAGSGTYRRVLVARADRADLAKLADLRGRSLGVVETAGPAEAVFLERAVFEDEVEPASWFGRLELAADDFTATSAVLYGQADAALVSEHNPLLREHLGKDLKALYTSPPLSLPVLAVRAAAFDPARRRALATAVDELGDDPRGRKLIEVLGLDGFESVPAAAARVLAELPSSGGKEMEIALPGGGAFGIEIAPPPAGLLPFLLTVDLPEVPLPREGGDR